MSEYHLVVPDLTDPKTYINEDMLAVWRQLRVKDPIHWHGESAAVPGFWVLTRYADIVRVLMDSETFTSERGNVLATMLHGGDTGAGRMLAVTDGQHHTELRKLLLQAFAPRALEGVRRRVYSTVRRLLAEATELGNCDFAKDVAAVIPLQTICDLLDVPIQDRDEVLALTKSALSSDSESPEVDADRIARSSILEYFSELVATRRKHPGTDPISLMATADLAGGRLDDEDIILNCYSLIMGGDETSRLAMIGAVEAFIRYPDKWTELKNGVASVESATEEILRWTTPTMHFGRAAAKDVRLGDQELSAGDLVTLWLTSANRDETVFNDPDRLELSRSPNRHLALGHGSHFCLGASLGRIEISAMLDGLRTLVGSVSAAGPARRIYSNFVSGMSSLPITLTPDRQGGVALTDIW